MKFWLIVLYLPIGLAGGLGVNRRLRRLEIEEFRQTHDVGGMTDSEILAGVPVDSAGSALIIFGVALEWPALLVFFGVGYVLSNAFEILGKLGRRSTLKAVRR